MTSAFRTASNHNAPDVDRPDDLEMQNVVGTAALDDVVRSSGTGAKPILAEPWDGMFGGGGDVPRDEPGSTTANRADNLPKPGEPSSFSERSKNLSGWDGIEQHLLKHDTGEMKYYAEDIDTLLVFAGLFSAFLTAFVVQTYPMLTEDDSATTNQLLALSVSTQLRTTGIIIPSAINSTLMSLLDTTPFTPSPAARAINALFFVSLILSIASAFFGILCKQWIREYLKWNSALALPRENVLVRQDRIEAWEAWNVSALISSIPALLELAMMLFLCGIVILLWTLDDIVAIIITAFSAMLMIAAAAFTLLPVIYKNCPYKSPTAWACVAASEAAGRSLFDILQAVFNWLADTLPRFTPLTWMNFRSILTWADREYNTAQSWRDRDLENCRNVRCRRNGKSVQPPEAYSAAVQELKRVVGDLDVDLKSLTTATLVDIAESALLVRALTWVRRSSQDWRIRACTVECATSVHPEAPGKDRTYDSDYFWAVNRVANRCLLLALGQYNIHYPHSGLFALSDALEITKPPGPNNPPEQALHTAMEVQWLLKSFGDIPNRNREVIAHLLAADLERWSNHVETPYMCNVETCAVVYSLFGHGLYTDDHHDNALRAMMSVNFPAGVFEDLHESILVTAANRERLTLGQDQKLVFSDHATTSEEKDKILLWCPIDNYTSDLNDHVPVFLAVTKTRLRNQTPFYNDHDAQVAFRNIVAALERRADLIIDDQQWRISEICASMLDFLAQHHLPKLLLLCPGELRQWIHRLDKFYQGTRFIQGDTAHTWRLLHTLSMAAHKDLTVCEVENCHWLAHACSGGEIDYFAQCPLLFINDNAVISPSEITIPSYVAI